MRPKLGGQDVRRWEYKKIALNETSRKCDEIDLLCDAGEDGWELVAVLANGVAYLKWEIVSSALGDALETTVETTVANGGSASHVKPKYRDPLTGETWSGRGRMATWLKRKQDAGKVIDDYLV